MRTQKSGALFGVLAASLTIAAPAFGYGPKHEEGDRAVAACTATFERQLAKGIVARGGPKSTVDDAPTNCDHFWQDTAGDGGLIGNGHWPPPPFAN
jgi:hypothetical protein